MATNAVVSNAPTELGGWDFKSTKVSFVVFLLLKTEDGSSEDTGSVGFDVNPDGIGSGSTYKTAEWSWLPEGQNFGCWRETWSEGDEISFESLQVFLSPNKSNYGDSEISETGNWDWVEDSQQKKYLVKLLFTSIQAHWRIWKPIFWTAQFLTKRRYIRTSPTFSERELVERYSSSTSLETQGRNNGCNFFNISVELVFQ